MLRYDEIWNYAYQWQWLCNHRHALWLMVPKVLKELSACDAAPANKAGKKDRVRYGRRYFCHAEMVTMVAAYSNAVRLQTAGFLFLRHHHALVAVYPVCS